MTKKVSAHYIRFLEEECSTWMQEGTINEEQHKKILAKYETKKLIQTESLYIFFGLLFISISLFLLLGLNLVNIGLTVRLLLVFIIWFSSYFFAERLYQTHKKGKTFLFFFSSLLFGVLLYGIQLLYSNNIFETYIWLIWAVYLLPVALFRKQQWVWIIYLITLFYCVLSVSFSDINYLLAFLTFLLIFLTFILIEKTNTLFFHAYITNFPLFFFFYLLGFNLLTSQQDGEFYYSLIISISSFAFYLLPRKPKISNRVIQSCITFLPYLAMISGVPALFSGIWVFESSLVAVSLLHALFLTMFLIIIKNHIYSGTISIFLTIISFFNIFEMESFTKILIFLLLGIFLLLLAFYLKKGGRKQ